MPSFALLLELLRDPQVRLARLGDAVIAGSARPGMPGAPGSNRSPSFFRSSMLCGFRFSPGHGAPSGAAVACRAAGGHADVALPDVVHDRRGLDGRECLPRRRAQRLCPQREHEVRVEVVHVLGVDGAGREVVEDSIQPGCASDRRARILRHWAQNLTRVQAFPALKPSSARPRKFRDHSIPCLQRTEVRFPKGAD